MSLFWIWPSSGSVANEDDLNEVLVCRTGCAISHVVENYQKYMNKDLLETIKGKVDDKLFELYSIIISGDCIPDSSFDVYAIVATIHNIAMGGLDTNTTPILEILAKADANQLKEMNRHYHNTHGQDLRDVIKDMDHFSEGTKGALLRKLNAAVMTSEEAGERDFNWLFMLEDEKLHIIIFINRAFRLYWGSKLRLQRVEAECSKYQGTIADCLLSRESPRLACNFLELITKLFG
ncbi:hypothetical protein V8C35DRAFT_282683 [Trichoderma chlorosporum]